MAQDHDLVIRVVVNQLEVVASLPVVTLFPDEHAWKLGLVQVHDTVILVVVVLTIGAQEAGERVDLIEVGGQVIAEPDVAHSVAVDADSEITLEVLERGRLPFNIDIEPVGALRHVIHLEVSITILTRNVGFDKGGIDERIGTVLLHQVSNDIAVLVIRAPGQESAAKLRHSKRMESLLLRHNPEQEELILLVSILELLDRLVLAVDHLVVELGVFDVFVYGPEAEDFFEVVEVHPEDAVVLVAVEANLSSEL